MTEKRIILKINDYHLNQKIKGRKLFEIRKDEGFVVGDLIVYQRDGNDYVYRVTYVCDYKQRDGFVVFGEQLVEISFSDDVEECA